MVIKKKKKGAPKKKEKSFPFLKGKGNYIEAPNLRGKFKKLKLREIKKSLLWERKRWGKKGGPFFKKGERRALFFGGP